MTTTAQPGGAATVAPPSLRKVAEGVFAYVQPDGGWCLNNAGLVLGDGTSVLVDSAATERRARRLKDAVERVAPGGPRMLVNTHHHGDHHFGNAQFAPAATIVAHEQARAEMAEAGLGLRRLWPDVDWGETPLALPVLTFADALTLYVGDLRVELFHVGPAHTTNDVVAWVPERRVLFTGDVVMSGTTPYCLMGSISGSLRALARLRALEPETVVAGHGPVAGPEVIDATGSYLRWVRDLAAAGRRAGRTALETARAADLGEFAALREPERLVSNLHRAYAEAGGAAEGAPIDILGSFTEMVAYHGGLPECRA